MTIEDGLLPQDRLLAKFPNLEVLKFPGMVTLGHGAERAVVRVADACPRLHSVALVAPQEVALSLVRATAPRLRNFSVMVSRLAEPPAGEPPHMPALEKARFSGLVVNERFAAFIARGAPNLRVLDVVGVRGLSSETVADVVAHCGSLEELLINGDPDGHGESRADEVRVWRESGRLRSLRRLGLYLKSPAESDRLIRGLERTGLQVALLRDPGILFGGTVQKCGLP